MHGLYNLKEALIDELCEHGEKGVTKESLHEIDTLAHAAKNVCKIIDACSDDEYSGRYYSRDYGASYRRGRDRMGRFTSRDEGPDAPDMSRGMDNMSRAANKERTVQTLQQLMDTAADERTRGKFRELIRDMRNG